MQSTDEEALCSSGQSLWSLIRENVSEAQLSKIHTALGHSLVNRYTEAYTELERWQRMLQYTQQGLCSRTGTPLPGRHRPPLADPPVVKELIRAEVHMLLQTLRERAGRNGTELLSSYKPETVSYALGHAPRSHSSLSVENDLRSSSRLSMQSNAEVEFEAVRENLKTDDVEQVVDRLKSLFVEESEALKQEIKQLRRNIWRKSQQDLEPAEPTLGDLKELRDAIQKDLSHYSLPYSSSVKDLKSTHRLASAASFQPRVSSASSVRNIQPLPNYTSFTQPKPPSGRPPVKTCSSTKPHSVFTPSNTNCGTFSIPEVKETALSQHGHLHSGSISRLSCSLTRRHSDNPPLGHSSPQCTIPANAYSFPIKPEKNSETHKTHMTSQGAINNEAKESNLSPRMERKQSGGHGSGNTDIASSAVSPCGYGCNKDSKSSDCPGEMPKPPNGQRNKTSGNTLLTRHDDTGQSIGLSSNESEMGFFKEQFKEKDRNVNHQKEAGFLYTKPKAHFSTSLTKSVLKVSASQVQKEKPERTETEYLNRFIQPVPPSRVK